MALCITPTVPSNTSVRATCAAGSGGMTRCHAKMKVGLPARDDDSVRLVRGVAVMGTD